MRCMGLELQSTSSSTVAERRMSDVVCPAACSTGRSGRVGFLAETDLPRLGCRLHPGLIRAAVRSDKRRSPGLRTKGLWLNPEGECTWFESGSRRVRAPAVLDEHPSALQDSSGAGRAGESIDE